MQHHAAHAIGAAPTLDGWTKNTASTLAGGDATSAGLSSSTGELAQRDVVIPSCLPDHFVLQQVESAGKMGWVWSAVDTQSGRKVAVKVSRGNAPSLVAALKREFRAASELTHPNLVRMDALYVDRTSCAITMEWVDGVELQDVAPGDGLRAMLIQLVEGLAAIHRAGFVHGDLKGRNVLQTPEGRVVILDFGLAQLRSPHTRTLGGTLAYMSPEALRGEAASRASDRYALGVMLYETLCGQRPVRGTQRQQLDIKTSAWFPRPSELRPSLDPALGALTMELLHPDPAERPDLDAVMAVLAPRRSVELHTRWQARPELEARLDQVLGHPVEAARVVRVVGAGGTGKTSLVRRVLGRSPTRVLWGRCDPLEQVSFRGLDALADQTVGALGRPTRWPDDIVTSLRSAGQLFPQLVGRPGDLPSARDPVARTHSARALATLHARIAASVPLVMVLDDVQWMGNEARSVVREWAAALAGPITLCLIARTPVELGLSLPETLIEVGFLPRRLDASAAPWLQPPPAAPEELPRWTAHVRAQLVNLHEGVAAAVRWCAIAGGPLERQHLEALGTREFTVRRAVTTGVLRLHAEAHLRLVRVVHPTVAVAVLDGAAPARAERARLAEVLDAGPGRWAVRAAELYDTLGESAAAARSVARAGHWALHRGAFAEAHRLLQDARTRGAPVSLWAEALGQAELALGRVDTTLAVWNAARRDASGADRVRLSGHLATLVFGHGHTTEGMQILDDMLADVGETLPRSMLSAAWRAWGAPLSLSSGAATSADTDTARTRLEALLVAGRAVLVVAPMTGAMVLARHKRLADAVDDPLHLVLAAIWQCWSKGSQGRDTTREDAALDELLRRHHRLVDREPRIRAEQLSARASAYLGASRLAEAGDTFEEAAAAWRACSGESWELRFCLAGVLHTRMHERPIGEMHHEIESFRRYALSMGDVRSSVELALGAGIFPHLYRTGSGEQNLAYIEAALADWTDAHPPESELRILYARAQAHLAMGDVARAQTIMQTVPLRVRALRVFPMARFALDGLHARVLAHLHPTGQSRKLQRLLDGLAATGAELPLGLVAGIRAGLAAERGDLDTARTLGQAAVAHLGRARQHVLAAGLRVHDARLRTLGFADPAGFRRVVFGPGTAAVAALLAESRGGAAPT